MNHERDDRRRHGRVRCPRVTCRFAGQVEDMSASGLRLRLNRPSPVAKGSGLTLVLGSASDSVEVKARVVWSRSSAAGHDLGLAFDGTDPCVRAALFNLAWNGPDAAGPVASLALSDVGSQ